MNAKAHIVRTLVTSFIIALLITFYLQPKISLGTLYELGIILTIELVGFVTARYLTEKSGAQTIVRTLLLSFAFAGLIIILSPSVQISFDVLFISLSAIEFIGFGLGWYLTR